MKKVLLLLSTLVLYINYQNYIMPDIKKLHREITALESSIERELTIQTKKYKQEDFLLNYDKVTFSAKEYSYSKAMGEMQNQIYEAAMSGCTVQNIQWAQVPISEAWYDKLKMNIRLKCTPNELLKFTNSLKSRETIYRVESFVARKLQRDSSLSITAQLVGFRAHQ